jgi:formylglycine-generating enzyme required for sulfatase activity
VTTLIDYLLTGEWPADPVQPSGPQVFTVNGVSFTMIPVEAGTFEMGATKEQEDDAYSREKPAHWVTLTKDFYMGQTEVTQELWVAVMGSNPSYFTPTNGYEDYLQRPVELVSWDVCQEFIAELNRLTGQNFRLPTEAEWEYAARGGNLSQFYKYSGSNTLDEVGWFGGNSQQTTHPVATKAPNELGLYDMSGNVREWCQDRYGSYSADPQTDPTGSDNEMIEQRVIRGGAWSDSNMRDCRVSWRQRNSPDEINAALSLGLRLAL